MTPYNHEIHNLGIHALHLGIARILTILVNHQSKKLFIKKKDGDFFPNMGHVSNESKTSL